ncbi:DUF2058 domain-containing protein [Alloalcanivorax xenomutans]|jgi:uncharacterized protein|uniref:DUF2058 domain-containing protein n=1 Tax=Alloalcanivorax xenomutans TaxID=1094342 RepID=UPI0003B8DB6C|nr:DUF2058 domain-containing protein [Alloalcanivorax xenomutans]ERS15348.1 nucleoprotein/polynucleotide-associated enzyme [Alcanivorax sp. PN-3]MBA4719986.1 DUF2058 domain-containing protein [Alcanivorax sp.]ARB44549.1 nucleoprotein/polynucleotide-associated enzyme [Alloalcanivorax xenomutans]MCE7523179.1 DUF2058 domain-containing protein [Alloalcanivorax xenomutans]PHS56324.1 MAG: DUF2058 domain-containing protein [Alcanivorax sp.]
MANSLQQQLMKAGLADKKAARRAKQQKREDANRARREGGDEDAAERARRQRQEQAERDRQLEVQRQAEREEREKQAQLRQLIEAHRLPREQGEVGFRFVQERKVKTIYVTASQQTQLANGRLVLVALGEGYELVPAEVVDKIRERDESVVLVCNTPSAKKQDEDDPYAGYEVPDDLMW